MTPIPRLRIGASLFFFFLPLLPPPLPPRLSRGIEEAERTRGDPPNVGSLDDQARS